MANTNGVLDKYRIRGIQKSAFNPGRNASWDWNELLTTIENNFESDFDLDALKTDIGNNQTNIATNATGITANLEKNNVQEVQIATLNTNVDKALSDIVTLTAKVAGICLCLPECPACGKKAK